MAPEFISSLQLCDVGTQPLDSRWKTPWFEGRFHSLPLLDSSAGQVTRIIGWKDYSRTAGFPSCFCAILAKAGPSMETAI